MFEALLTNPNFESSIQQISMVESSIQQNKNLGDPLPTVGRRNAATPTHDNIAPRPPAPKFSVGGCHAQKKVKTQRGHGEH